MFDYRNHKLLVLKNIVSSSRVVTIFWWSHVQVSWMVQRMGLMLDFLWGLRSLYCEMTSITISRVQGLIAFWIDPSSTFLIDVSIRNFISLWKPAKSHVYYKHFFFIFGANWEEFRRRRLRRIFPMNEQTHKGPSKQISLTHSFSTLF